MMVWKNGRQDEKYLFDEGEEIGFIMPYDVKTQSYAVWLKVYSFVCNVNYLSEAKHLLEELALLKRLKQNK